MASSSSDPAGLKGRDVEPVAGAAQGGGDAAPLESGSSRPAEPAQGDPAPPPFLHSVVPAPQAVGPYVEPRRLRPISFSSPGRRARTWGRRQASRGAGFELMGLPL